ncbi:MAG: hypothetical protein RBU21_24185 [FCB group bacterium]|jgi:hypothetical protein|nr:hypothetical protein [FCB group bacterium]
MDLTRRAFLRTLLLAAAAAAVGRGVCAAAVPETPLRYPGPLRPLRNTGQPGIWKG